MKRKRILLAAALVLIAMYAGAYVTLRANHTIMHKSNAHHWVPHKRQAGHRVSCSSGSLGSQLAGLVFKPAMSVEESCRNMAD